MIRILIVFAIVTIGQADPVKEAGYLLAGGKDADISEVPYLATLIHQNGFTCGGSIISKSYILTGAYCVMFSLDPKDYTVRVGSSYSDKEGTVMKVSKITVHPEIYNPNANYDFALLQLETPIKEFDSKVKSIALPSADQKSVVGYPASLSGWDRSKTDPLKTERLQKAEVSLMDLDDCRAKYGRMGRLTENLLCGGAAEQNFCDGI
jgi:trypsin